MSAFPTGLVAAFADRYRIERELGVGGMATVYLAHDIKHDRSVALKVLRSDLSQTLGAERFLREIRLAARLNHPHILPLFDSGDADGALFYVMPNVQGRSLRDRMNEGRSLPVDEAVRIATAVAGALDYAHRHGVVHRDIKPENIMLQDGHALVADFGIGKALSAVEGDAFTQTGMSVGTPAYMSPEQAAGEEVDGRSDVYSLGCVLYEMLVGEQPFTGPTVQAVIAKRFVQTPADVTALRDGIPRPIARAVHRALARTPIDRYETGAHLVAALAEPESAAVHPAAPEKSIAVLPFTCLTSDPDDVFFADGVTEEILNSLAQIPGLAVAARSSVFTFKGRSEDPRSVGTKLNVATVLEGTMRRAGNRLRVTVQLISTSDGYQLWSERYDRVLEDVFAVQDEIAAAIAGRLRVSLGATKAAGANNPPTANIAAYQLYLKGRALLYRRGRSILDGLECFKEAVALDPGYAQAWAGVADGFSTAAYSGFLSVADSMPHALAAARRAVALEADLAEAHCALACAVLIGERDYAQAEREFLRAIELNPNYLQARGWYGLFYLQWVCGREREGLDELTRNLEKDPLSAYAHFLLSFSLSTRAGRLEEAIGYAERGLALDSDSYLGLWSYLIALTLAGRYEEGERAAERALALSGLHGWALTTLAELYRRWGRPAKADELYREAVERSTRERIQPSMMIVAAVAVGDVEAAIGYARQSVDDGDPLFALIARDWPFYAPLRSDPRFTAIVAELRLPDYMSESATPDSAPTPPPRAA